MKILIPNTIELDLPPDLGEMCEYDPAVPVPQAHLDAEVLVAWHNTAGNLADAAERLGALRLVQTLAAGPDAVIAAGFPAGVVIASGQSLHDQPVAEHTLALILAQVRGLEPLRAAQAAHVWDREFNRSQSDPATAGLYTLSGAQVVIWGFGSIAQTLAPLLVALGATVTGVATRAGNRGGFDVVADRDIADILPRADILVSILPSTPDTDHIFGDSLIRLMKPTSIFVNVGRGSTVDTEALARALHEGRLRAAAIDVVDQEPLPPESSLWSTPHLTITPHVAGNRPRGASALVAANVRALTRDEPLINVHSAPGNR